MALTYEIEAPGIGETTCKVTFTNDEPSIVHIRYIQAEFDGDGMYLPDPTLEIVRQLSNGIESKIIKGVISESNNIIEDGPHWPEIEEEE
jgi:hypothetical protein